MNMYDFGNEKKNEKYFKTNQQGPTLIALSF